MDGGGGEGGEAELGPLTPAKLSAKIDALGGIKGVVNRAHLTGGVTAPNGRATLYKARPIVVVVVGGGGGGGGGVTTATGAGRCCRRPRPTSTASKASVLLVVVVVVVVSSCSPDPGHH